ncbi:DUF3887 domain-containing protein [Humibacter ginsenosidimutans]|uniref:DUF3887 domain-containing protein n=1 Tax=Humibacter ginsenosidimutans TaxID=2599293 RepID=UPI001FF037F2|nr:DUF3887 domain-containing protein [Humibacter ginsenosidimutans]
MIALRARLDELTTAPVLADPDDGGRLVTAAAGVRDAAEGILIAAVRQARDDGASWQTIGDALGVTRQAAFQRYGKPVDPRTGEPMSTHALPEATSLAGDVIDELAAGEWAKVVARFDDVMTQRLPEDALGSAWAYIAANAGAYERRGETVSVRAGDLTVTNTPLAFEAGDYTARITFRDDHTIAGLYILEAAAS